MMSPMKIKYRETKIYQRKYKKLVKKYKSLPDDLQTVKEAAIELFHIYHIDNRSVFQIQDVGSESFVCYIVKKIACKAMKGKGVKSGLRLTYVYDVENSLVYLVEIYHKADQSVEDKDLLKEVVEYLVRE